MTFQVGAQQVIHVKLSFTTAGLIKKREINLTLSMTIVLIKSNSTFLKIMLNIRI